MSASVKAEDGRRQGWYWADNATMRLVLTKLGPFGAAVYTALAIRSNAQREAWPDVEVLAADAGMSRRRAVAALADLVGLGVLEVSHRRSVDGRQAASVYRLIDPDAARVQEVHPGKPAARVQETAGQSAGNSAPECTTCTHIEEQYPRTIHKNKNNSSPLRGSSSSRRARPALPDHDGDAGQGIGHDGLGQDHEALDVIGFNVGTTRPDKKRAALLAIRAAAPKATADDIRGAIDEWRERWERIKGHTPDPIQASQLPDVVATWMNASRRARRTGHGLVPVIER